MKPSDGQKGVIETEKGWGITLEEVFHLGTLLLSVLPFSDTHVSQARVPCVPWCSDSFNWKAQTYSFQSTSLPFTEYLSVCCLFGVRSHISFGRLTSSVQEIFLLLT